MLILPLDPSAIVILPELEPEFVFKIKSPVPCVVIVALALLSPTITVSAPRFTSPVPFGIISMFAFEVDTISLPFISKSPPNCGDVSFFISTACFATAAPEPAPSA